MMLLNPVSVSTIYTIKITNDHKWLPLSIKSEQTSIDYSKIIKLNWSIRENAKQIAENDPKYTLNTSNDPQWPL